MQRTASISANDAGGVAEADENGAAEVVEHGEAEAVGNGAWLSEQQSANGDNTKYVTASPIVSHSLMIPLVLPST